MSSSAIEGLMDYLQKKDKQGVITTIEELKENQFGLPLEHYAQWYLFGANALRLKVFHSIAGMPQSCKSPLLFDLMGHVCADPMQGGLGGIGFLYELEDKISPTLLASMMSRFGDIIDKTFRPVKGLTIEEAISHIATKIIPAYKKFAPSMDVPVIIGLDSIGGSASSDTVKKITTEGSAGKGFYDKAHYMKYFCENAGHVIGDIPMVIMCINQEKEQAAATPYAPIQKKITGGVSQVFKDGHMISASYKTLGSGDGKIITLKTTKTSFSDARKIEVVFKWNKFGANEKDAYGHKFNWALATAKCLADPDKGVGELRDIADVKVSDLGLVTCPQLGCKSVQPEEFEQALMDPSNKEILDQLCVYQKIDKIKGMSEYKEYLKARKDRAKQTASEVLDEPVVEVKKVVRKKTIKAQTIEEAKQDVNGVIEPTEGIG